MQTGAQFFLERTCSGKLACLQRRSFPMVDLMTEPDSKTPALNSAVLLAAATAYLYCVSTAHYGGYLSPLRLDADVLDRPRRPLKVLHLWPPKLLHPGHGDLTH